MFNTTYKFFLGKYIITERIGTTIIIIVITYMYYIIE